MAGTIKKTNTRLVKVLIENDLCIAFAESVTCGLAAHQLSVVKGTAEVLAGSVVCYHPDAKINALGISGTMIEEYTAESQEISNMMAKNLNRLFDADIYVGVTGLASAGGSETKEKPVGTIFIAILYKNQLYEVRKLFRGNPLEIKEKACNEIFRSVIKLVNNGNSPNNPGKTA